MQLNAWLSTASWVIIIVIIIIIIIKENRVDY